MSVTQNWVPTRWRKKEKKILCCHLWQIGGGGQSIVVLEKRVSLSLSRLSPERMSRFSCRGQKLCEGVVLHSTTTTRPFFLRRWVFLHKNATMYYEEGVFFKKKVDALF